MCAVQALKRLPMIEGTAFDNSWLILRGVAVRADFSASFFPFFVSACWVELTLQPGGSACCQELPMGDPKQSHLWQFLVSVLRLLICQECVA